ncbi:uncharacterized protein LOC135933929 [Cloeon dipterum]|uniref:uncharacterized protein LOC135933929 n=1 Tax=Cloeon dipterum TaxID=197152 RepID=UPI00321FD520
MASQKSTVMAQVESVEDDIKKCYHRIETIERNLKSKHLDMDQREELERELDNVKALLSQQEQDLKKLRTENSKTFVIALAIMFLGFLAFGVYKILTNG